MKRKVFLLFVITLLAFSSAGQASTLFLPDPCVTLGTGNVSAVLFDKSEQTVARDTYTLINANVEGFVALDWPAFDPKRVQSVRFKPEDGAAAYVEVCARANLSDIPVLYAYTVTIEGINADRIAKIIGYARIPDPTCSVPIDLEVMSLLRHDGDASASGPQSERPSADHFSFCFVSGDVIKLRFGIRNLGQALFSWYETLRDMQDTAPGDAVAITLMISSDPDGREKHEFTLTIKKEVLR